jgi:hypothetical protein
VPIIRRTYCIYVTVGICLSVWLAVWFAAFRATICPSSGELTVSMRQLVFVSLYGWLSGLLRFGQLCAHHQEKLLYLCDTGIFHSVWVAVWSVGIFISTSLHVSGNYVPIIKRNYCIYATLVFFTLYGWLCGLLISTSLHVSGNYVPIIRRNYCIYATLVFFTLYE